MTERIIFQEPKKECDIHTSEGLVSTFEEIASGENSRESLQAYLNGRRVNGYYDFSRETYDTWQSQVTGIAVLLARNDIYPPICTERRDEQIMHFRLFGKVLLPANCIKISGISKEMYPKRKKMKRVTPRRQSVIRIKKEMKRRAIKRKHPKEVFHIKCEEYVDCGCQSEFKNNRLRILGLSEYIKVV
jgi:hypothetical protein